MKEKVNDFRNKTEEEVFNMYKKIAIKDQLINKIWEYTGNVQDALKLYEKIEKNKEDEGNEQ